MFRYVEPSQVALHDPNLLLGNSANNLAFIRNPLIHGASGESLKYTVGHKVWVELNC